MTKGLSIQALTTELDQHLGSGGLAQAVIRGPQQLQQQAVEFIGPQPVMVQVDGGGVQQPKQL